MNIEEKLADIVGASNVIQEPGVIDTYAEDISFVNPVKPGYLVKPGSGDEIKKIVDLARENLIPLVPVSSGPPHFRGDTVPGQGGAIVVDLYRMDKIIRIDRTNRVAMFEPGVTFKQLIPAVADKGLRLNMPLMPRLFKSVTGSMLEREPVIMPKYHWDISDPLNCVEIIFGTGDMFRTGAAAGPGTLEEQWTAGGAQVEAAGPSSSSWYRVIQGSQGTMGIVTWASARCEILPKFECSFLIGSTKIEEIIEMVHWLLRLRLVNECFVLNNSNLAAVTAGKWPQEYEEIKSRLPPWILLLNIAGYDYFPEDRVKNQVEDMKELAQRVGVEPQEYLGGVSAPELVELARHPCKEPYWKLRYKGACEDLFFITIYEKLPDLITIINQAAEKAGYPVSDIGIYLQPIVQGTNCHCEFSFFYDPQNTSESNRVKSLSQNSLKKLIASGAFFSRPYGQNAEVILNSDAATVAALKKLKSILDPLNIMNPGKLCF